MRSAHLLLLAAILLPLLLSQLLVFHQRLGARQAQEKSANIEVAAAVARSFDNYSQELLRIEAALGVALSSPAPLDPSHRDSLLTQAANQYPGVRSFHWLDPNGTVVDSSAPGLQGLTFDQSPHWRRLAQGNDWEATDIITLPSISEPSFAVMRGMRDETKALRGAVIAIISPSQVRALLGLDNPTYRAIALIDRNGAALWGRDPSPDEIGAFGWAEMFPADLQEGLSRARQGEVVSGSLPFPSDGAYSAAALVPVGNTGWVAAVWAAPSAWISASLLAIAREGALLLFIVVDAVLISLIISSYFSLPIRKTIDYAMAVSSGARTEPVEPSGPAEVRDLVRAIQDIAGANEHRREQYRRLLEVILEAGRIGAAVVAGPELRFEMANAAYRAVTSRPEMDPVGKAYRDIWPPEEGWEADNSRLRQVLSIGMPYYVAEHRVQLGNEEERFFSVHYRPIRWADGTAVLIVLTETTDLVRARMKAEADRNHIRRLNVDLANVALQLRTVLDKMPSGVVICDQEARITITNREADRLFGRPVPRDQDYLTHSALQIGHPDGTPCDPRELPFNRSALRGETLTNVELLVHRPDGSIVSVLANSAPIFDGQGNPQGAVGVLQDITYLKELDRQKDEFLSIAAHELRTPMASMKGFAQLLLRHAERLPEDRERWTIPLRTIDSQVNRMVALVDRLLDVSRIEMKRLELDLERVDLVALARQLVAETQVTTSRHRLTVACALEELYGNLDRARINQVLTNILANAIQYSPEGGEIIIRIWKDGGQAMVSVSDQGVGIPSDCLTRVFERDFRTQQAVLSRADGMGLGLYVAKGIIIAHGGRIWAESEMGKGSTFYFALPIAGRPADSLADTAPVWSQRHSA